MRKSYQYALLMAILLHIALGICLIKTTSTKEKVMELTERQDKTHENPAATKTGTVKAVTVNDREVEATIKRIKEDRVKKAQAEKLRQSQLEKQANVLRLQRIREQENLKRIKNEALAQKKEFIEEKKRLENLKHQQKEEELRRAALKKLQETAAQKKEELKRIEQEKMRQDELMREAIAEKEARIAGEVDKYKALIINAISRRWILPEKYNHEISSQFRIRLGPDGSVLTVNLTKTSGDSVLDRSAQAAIYKASPLPVPSDKDAFDVFRDISLTVRPEIVSSRS